LSTTRGGRTGVSAAIAAIEASAQITLDRRLLNKTGCSRSKRNAAVRNNAVMASKLIRVLRKGNRFLVTAQCYLKEMNDGVLQNPKVRLRVDDARNFMAISDEEFDTITTDPSHPRITGVGYLYTREYYERVKESLRPGGSVTQRCGRIFLPSALKVRSNSSETC